MRRCLQQRDVTHQSLAAEIVSHLDYVTQRRATLHVTLTRSFDTVTNLVPSRTYLPA